MERLGFGYEDLQQGASGPDLLLAVRLWPHRPLQASPRLRSGRAGDERHHELHRRTARRTAGEMRRAAVRHHRRHSRSHGHPRRLHPSSEDRRRAMGRNLACSRPRWCRPTGSRPSRSRPAWRRARWARRIRSMRPIRRSRPPTAGSWSAAPTRSNWLRTLEALGATELARDPRFVDRRRPHGTSEGAGSRAHRRASAPDPPHTGSAALDEKGVPCGPVHDMLQALSDPQTIAREMVVEVEHSTLGRVKTIGLPVKFSETPGKVRSGAPLYGEHTSEVLGEYGFDDDEIAALDKEGAIAAAEFAGEASADGGTRNTPRQENKNQKLTGGHDVSEIETSLRRRRSRHRPAGRGQRRLATRQSRSSSSQRPGPAAAPTISRARCRTSSPNTS